MNPAVGQQPLTSSAWQQTPVGEEHKCRLRWVEACAAGFICVLVVIICYRGFDPKLTDFRMFYAAAEMIRYGAAHKLYDLAEQHAFQARFAGKIGLIFDYPAATALLYVPGARFSMQVAYLVWTIMSVVALLSSSFLINAALGLFRHPTILFVISLLFIPVWLNFMQGQIVLILVFAYSLSLYLLVKGREFEAGCALALGLVKFHLVLPFIFVLLLRKRWRSIVGFTGCSVGFAVLCIVTAGWRSLLDYAGLLLKLPSLPNTGMHLNAMANLHGLFVGLFHREPPIIGAVVVSVALLIWSRTFWADVELGFATTMVVTVLVSYHLNPHDLCLLLIPIAVLMKRAALVSWHSVPVFLLAPPLPLFLLGKNFWLMGCSVIVLLVALARLQPMKQTHLPEVN
jgi:hypothetical protein